MINLFYFATNMCSKAVSFVSTRSLHCKVKYIIFPFYFNIDNIILNFVWYKYLSSKLFKCNIKIIAFSPFGIYLSLIYTAVSEIYNFYGYGHV